MDLKEMVISYMKNDDYKKMNAHDLAIALSRNSSKEFVSLVKTLNELEDLGIITHNKVGEFDLIERLALARGIIDVKQQGYGFVSTDLFDKDIFIPEGLTLTAISGDEVLVTVKKDSKGYSGKVEKILKRSRAYIYGTINKHHKTLYVVPDDAKIDIIVILKTNQFLDKAKIGDKVKAKITNYSSYGECSGEVVEILGNSKDIGIDITMLVKSAEVSDTFSDTILQTTKKIPNELSQKDCEKRRDLRHKLIVTIDGIDAKDFDDAINVEKLSNGNYLLGVYIADVSHYVESGSLLDDEAYKRAFSIYLPDRVIPMLPEKLSNGLCSLNPHEDRLVMACEMEIDKTGKVISHEVFEGIINSKERLTYQDVNEFFEKRDRYNSSLQKMLDEASQLMKILSSMRKARGSLDFEVPEAKIVLNAYGEAVDVIPFERGISEKMIEEFMLVCNETIAESMNYAELPCIYRVHEEPKADKLMQFTMIARILGYTFPRKGVTPHPKQLQTLLATSSNDDKGSIIHDLMLRSMAKARYSNKNLGHYGLASECYTHFTSPIRRYADLMVHRAIKEYYLNHNSYSENTEILMGEIATHISAQEKTIEKLERSVTDMKKAEYMENYIGEVFEGVISSVVKWGFYVELPNTIEGLVASSTFDSNDYTFNEELLLWSSKRKKRQFQMGDRVEVIVESASKDLREINFIVKGANRYE